MQFSPIPFRFEFHSIHKLKQPPKMAVVIIVLEAGLEPAHPNG